MSHVEFFYQNQKIGDGNFALARSNVLPDNSSAAQNNSQLSELLKTKPVTNEKLLQDGYPNVNDYRNDQKGYIDELTPGYSDLIKDNLDYIKNRANQKTSPANVPNSNNQQFYGEGSQPPAFLLQAWITVNYAGYSVTTYDFNWLEAAGQRGLSIQGWQKIGTLGWQSNQNYSYNTFVYNSAANQVIIKSATGYQQQWNILKVENTQMLVESNGEQFTLFNCSAQGWPDGIKAAMKGCRQ